MRMAASTGPGKIASGNVRAWECLPLPPPCLGTSHASASTAPGNIASWPLRSSSVAGADEGDALLRIDALLGGGLHEGQLTELVEPSSSGKTQACLMSASTVAKQKSSVIYLDTGNSFLPQHIAHFIAQSSGYVFGNQDML